MLPLSFRQRQRDYLLSCHDRDGSGGFVGPDGAADLYYTRFALQALDLLGGLDDAGLRLAAGEYLARQSRPESVVDWLCWLHGGVLLRGFGDLSSRLDDLLKARAGEAREFVRECGSAAGCYGDRPGGVAGPYFTMLAILVMELAEAIDASAVGGALSGASGQGITNCLLSYRSDDGGFAESTAAGGGGAQANPTAAALVALGRLGYDDRPTFDAAGAALVELQDESGGVRAHGAAPMADLMSTFTVMESLRSTRQMGRLRLAGAGRYVRGLALASGGFRGVAGHGEADVEYTFYGVGALALLSRAAGTLRGTR